jgi:NADPH-dependent 2,4-dienoyl-CoA reductase/sulfur reductase-like enzyme
MEKTDVLVIGGSAAGIVAARTAKFFHPEKDVMMIRREPVVVVPCGVPYIFGTLKSTDKNVIPDTALEKLGVKINIGIVEKIDQENKTCTTIDGKEFGFEKLIIATGSTPAVPGWLKGADLENVFVIPKDKEYLAGVREKLEECKNIVVIGGGFIGVEVADELGKLGKNVTIVEILPHILSLAFDEELAILAEEVVKSRGINVKSGSGIKEILGDKKASGVLLNNDEKIDADAVILAAGYRPNTAFAKDSGLELNNMGFIKVDEYMRTEKNPDIFAAGDCAEKRDFITGKTIGLMLASTACVEARLAGFNLYRIGFMKSLNGTIATFCTAVGDSAFGAAGITENQARKEGFDIVTGTYEGIFKHPGTLPGSSKQIVKIIATRESGVILGGSVMGGPCIGEFINFMSLVIQNRMTVYSALTAQIGTHPLLTGSPIIFPFSMALDIVAKKLREKS